jgi:hypothetical protein
MVKSLKKELTIMNYLQKQNAVRQYILAGESCWQICDRLGLNFNLKPNTMAPVVETQKPNLNKSKRYGRTQNSDIIGDPGDTVPGTGTLRTGRG